MKNFVLTYNASDPEINEVSLSAFVSENKHVRQWLSPFSGLIIIKSDVDLLTVRDSISRFMPSKLFVILEADPYRTGGSLTKEMWNWLNNEVLPPEVVEEIAKQRNRISAERRQLSEQNES